MKMLINVTRMVHQTQGIEVEIPDEELIGKTPGEVEQAMMDAAEAVACNYDYTGLENDAEYEAEPLDGRLPKHINWVGRLKDDGNGPYHLMVVGGFSPEDTLGTVTPKPTDLVGCEVEVPEPNENDGWNNAFVGVVVSYKGLHLVTVRDQEDNYYDVEFERVEPVG